MSKTRSRPPHEEHDKIFGGVLALVAGHNLVKAERIGVDGSTMEANAVLRTIVRRDTGERYREMLTRTAKESGIDTPTADDLVRLDRKPKSKKLSNMDWESATDPDAKVAWMKNGSTRLGYKPEHAVDLDTGVIVAAPTHPSDQRDTNTLDTASAWRIHEFLSDIALNRKLLQAKQSLSLPPVRHRPCRRPLRMYGGEAKSSSNERCHVLAVIQTITKGPIRN